MTRVWLNTEEVLKVGEKESEWLATHLPALKRVGLLRAHCFREMNFQDDTPERVQDRRRQRPSLDIHFVDDWVWANIDIE